MCRSKGIGVLWLQYCQSCRLFVVCREDECLAACAPLEVGWGCRGESMCLTGPHLLTSSPCGRPRLGGGGPRPPPPHPPTLLRGGGGAGGGGGAPPPPPPPAKANHEEAGLRGAGHGRVVPLLTPSSLPLCKPSHTAGDNHNHIKVGIASTICREAHVHAMDL